MGSSLKTEKAKLQEVRIGLKSDHVDLKSSISSQIFNLQYGLAMESKIVDALAVKNKKVNVLTIKLENAEKQANDLLSEKAVMKSYIVDVTVMLLDITKTRDSMITITVKKHIDEKLWPVFSMLHRLEGVPKSNNIPKQRGEQSNKDDHKPSANPVIKGESDPKGKEKNFLRRTYY
ncbi:unnamed protein product [Lactuca saligna]|uniref:Uncharacterized protein n=1 Tax=Lactuca saligna TaxID=75948 RepID=A0AA36E7K6_LACSI|nr:unnamed protein product [Lactuca saligna]